MTPAPRSGEVLPLCAADAARLAKLHAAAFATGEAWDRCAFETLMAQDSVLARGIIRKDELVSAILIQVAADQAEILTLATAPSHRRKGIARALLRGSETELIKMNINTWWLDVAADNQAGLKFYESLGFSVDGRRSGYYKRLEGNRVDAILMSRPMARQGNT